MNYLFRFYFRFFVVFFLFGHGGSFLEMYVKLVLLRFFQSMLSSTKGLTILICSSANESSCIFNSGASPCVFIVEIPCINILLAKVFLMIYSSQINLSKQWWLSYENTNFPGFFLRVTVTTLVSKLIHILIDISISVWSQIVHFFSDVVQI